jgi:hypothetical protein
MIRLSCHQCARQINAPDQLAGKKIRCPRCQQVLAVPAPAGAIQPLVLEAPPGVQAGGAQPAAMDPAADVIVEGVEVVVAPPTVLPASSPPQGSRSVPEVDELLASEGAVVVRHSPLKSLAVAAVGFLLSPGLIVVGLVMPGSCFSWGLVVVGVLCGIYAVVELRTAFDTRPILILGEEGIMDTRAEGRYRFLRWQHIDDVSSFVFRSNYVNTASVKVIVSDGLLQGAEHKYRVEGLNRSAAAIVNLIMDRVNETRAARRLP